MSLEDLGKSTTKTIGTKQTVKAVQLGHAKTVFIAEDAEPHVSQPLAALCKEKEIDIVWVKSMHELGKACGIDVGAASAAIIKE